MSRKKKSALTEALDAAKATEVVTKAADTETDAPGDGSADEQADTDTDTETDAAKYDETKSYVIALGNLTSKAGIKSPGDTVHPDMFAGGVETFESWMEREFIVEKKADEEEAAK